MLNYYFIKKNYAYFTINFWEALNLLSITKGMKTI